MAVSTQPAIHSRRLFLGICLALIPTGASFALVSNILIPLKQQFILTNYQVGLIGGAALWGMAISLLVMGPLLEAFGLKNGARLACAGHVIGITLMIAAASRAGDPSAFWLLMSGAATLAAGNGMIEVTGNPLVAALFPDEKTKRLNWFHAFFPIGIVLGGLVGFALTTWGGRFGHWPWQLAVIYLPIAVYGIMVLPQQFPKTENAAAGIPVGDMFRYTLTNPLFLLMLAMMAITTSMELGPMRWIPSVLQAGGFHGILVLVWISGWMVVLRGLAGHAVERLQPSGMLLLATLLTSTGLLLLSFASGTWSAFGAATLFAWGVAFFFPTMVGSVSERMPRTGSLGIVLTAGVGLGMAGAVGVPLMGKLADRYIAGSLPEQTVDLLTRVEQRFPEYLTRARATADASGLGYRGREVEDALNATHLALQSRRETGTVHSDATANALRAIVATAIPDEPLVAEANGVLQPAEAAGGQRSFRYVAPAGLVLLLVFGLLYAADRRRGGYRAVRLTATMTILLLAIPGLLPAQQARHAGRVDRLPVLFLGDNGHHRPATLAKGLMPLLASAGIDLFYTDDVSDLNRNELGRYQVVMLYNNQPSISPDQLQALLEFVQGGGGLVVVHCASASFQNSEEFIRLVGAAFKSHGTGTFTTVRLRPDHPAIQGIPAFESWDETYVHTKHNPVNRTVLEVRRENGHDEPWTWVRTQGKGRVFYTAWGHDERTWQQPGFQQLLERGIRWSAGSDWLTRHHQDPPIATITLPVPLPTYKRPPAPWNTMDTAVHQAQAALSPPASLELMTLRPRFTARMFASEPLIGRIIDFAWDARGRLWVVETNDYPNVVLPDSVPGHDRILILEDTKNTGAADRVTVFADGLNLATSLAFANGGVVVGQAPHMLFLRDTNGDDKADERRVLFTGFPRGDTHGTISNLRYGFDNQVWGSVGYNGFRGTVGPSTYARGQFGSGYFRFPVDGSNLEYVARTSNNTWGVALTEDNFVFGSTANARPSDFVAIPLRYTRGIGARDTVLPGIADRIDVFPVRDILQVDQFGNYTAGSAHEIYTARAFPREYWNRIAFVAEPTAHVIGMFALSGDGSDMRAKNRWSFLASRDAWASPVQVKVGPDGALWVSDFYSLVIQHNPTPEKLTPECCKNGPGNAYETPNRNHFYSRIYRIAYDSAPAAPRLRLDHATPDQLVATLRNDNLFWRLTAQRLLVERAKSDVVPALIRLARDQTVDREGMNPGALHALWTLQGLGALARDSAALQVVRASLSHPAAAIRRAALMMLPRTPELLDEVLSAGLLPDRDSPWTVEYTVPSAMLEDADAHVRLEALLALSEIPASDRAARTIAQALLIPANARDPWIPDAAAVAGAKQGPGFLLQLLKARLPGDSLGVAGMQRTLSKLARYHAGSRDAATVVGFIAAIPGSPAPYGVAVLGGIAEGWPEEQPPSLSAEQRATLRDAAQGVTPELQAAFGKVSARWAMPDLFTPR